MKYKEKILKIILAIFILIFTVNNINKLNIIQVVGDEYGYWANAAQIAGYNWKEVNSLNSYYSYGYSLFLIPIMFLFNNAIISYKIAIVLNAVFIILSFFIIMKIGRYLFCDMNEILNICVSFIISLYSSSLLLSQHTVGECLMYFLYWLMVYTLIKIIVTSNYLWVIIFNLLLLFLYSVHMRNIGVLLAGLVTEGIIFLYNKNNNKNKYIKFIFLLISIIVLFLCLDEVKGYFINSVYQSNAKIGANDYTGQIGKLLSIFSFNGFKLLIQSIIGKVWNFGVSTVCIGYIGVYYICKRLYLMLRGKDNREGKENIVYFFLLLSLVAELLIASIFTLEGGRMDVLLYGRYYEQVIGPIIFVGIYVLLHNKINVKCTLCIIILFIILGLITYPAIESQRKVFYSGNAIGVAKIGFDTGTLYTSAVVLYSIALIILFGIIIFLLLCRKNFIGKLIGLFFISYIWIGGAYTVLSQTTYSYQKQVKTVVEMVNEIEEIDENQNIYFVNENSDFVYADYLQFLFWRKPVKVVDYSNIEFINQGWVVTYKQTKINNYLKTKDYLLIESDFMDAFLIPN